MYLQFMYYLQMQISACVVLNSSTRMSVFETLNVMNDCIRLSPIYVISKQCWFQLQCVYLLDLYVDLLYIIVLHHVELS